MEFGKAVRVVGLVTAVSIGGSILEGCSAGQAAPPTIKKIQQDSHFFEMTRPNGTKMECVEYGGSGYQTI